MSTNASGYCGEFNVIVERGVTERIDGHDYYLQLWTGFPAFDKRKSVAEDCFLIYKKEENTYRAVLGKTGVKNFDKIKRNISEGNVHVAFCRDVKEGVRVDHLTARSPDGLELLILQVKGVFYDKMRRTK